MLNSGFENNAKLPYDMLPLKNGNFAFAGGDWLNLKGRLTITDNNFNVLFNRIYSTPAVYQGFFIRGICEKADGNIFFTASTVGNNSLIYPIVLRTGSTGIQKSQKIIIDNIYNETPNCLINYKDGMLGVSSRMAGEIYPNNNGALVNYLNNELAGLISSRINLNQYDTAGHIIGRKEIINYLGNGMINSLKSTSDGGFILCGTVNQSNFTSILSATKIYLLKIDANLNEQWSQSINTAYQAYGVDAFQTTDGGYLVSGHQRSFDKIFEMVVIKTDASGNIK